MKTPSDHPENLQRLYDTFCAEQNRQESDGKIQSAHNLLMAFFEVRMEKDEARRQTRIASDFLMRSSPELSRKLGTPGIVMSDELSWQTQLGPLVIASLVPEFSSSREIVDMYIKIRTQPDNLAANTLWPCLDTLVRVEGLQVVDFTAIPYVRPMQHDAPNETVTLIELRPVTLPSLT
jgi:hypothetical protein